MILDNENENLKVHEWISAHVEQGKMNMRFVPDTADKGEEPAIQELDLAMKGWLDCQAAEEVEQEDSSSKKVMGKEAKDVLSKLRCGNKGALERIKQNVKTDEKFQLENFDLITWFLVTV